MRRALLPRLPMLTKFYGLKPWEIDQMSLREIDEYLIQLDRYLADMEAANNGG